MGLSRSEFMIDLKTAYDLSGRVAVVTGAGSGIGLATAETLGASGARVVLGDLDEDAATRAAAEIVENGGEAIAVRADVTVRADVDRLVGEAVSTWDRLDIMGNVAGVPHNRPFADVSEDELDRILAINLKSVVYGCQAALRVMTEQGSGSIVNVSSGAIDSPAPTLACYGMAKAAVAMLTKTLAMEAGPKGVRVNALAPGIILTNFSRQHFTRDDGSVDAERLEAYKKRFGERAPLGRVGTPQDVAWAFLYLAAETGSFVTGQILRPNGGVAMPW